MNDTREKSGSSTMVGLLLLMLVAALLRMHGISRESLWWDEYTSHVYLDAPSLFEFLLLNRTLDPLTLPVYYILEYLWTHYVHDSVYALRILSIGIGVATIPFLYAVGKRIHGSWAGWVAAGLLAASPVHIHHSQSIRMYVVFVFLTMVVIWSFIRLLDKPRALLWLVHGLASFLLYWTHPFAGLVPAAQGAYLLLHFFVDRKFFFRWTFFQVVLFAPTVAYLASVRFWPKDTTGDWIMPPSFGALLADLFFDDISAFHWQFRLGDFAQSLGWFRMSLDILFAALLLALPIWLVARLLFVRPAPDPRLKNNLLLLGMWLILPPVMLFLVSWAVRPCMFPRYTVHCILAMYLLLGCAVQFLGSLRHRVIVSAALIGLMLLQWLWLQPGPQRTDWRAAAQLIHAEAGPDDIVLVENTLWRDVFVHNARHVSQGPLPIPVAAARGARPLAAATLLYLGIAPRHGLAGSANEIRVWVVYGTDYFDPAPLFAFEDMITANGLVYERRFFPAIRNIHVYAVRAPASGPLPGDIHETLTLISEDTNDGMDHHMMQAFGDLATELAEHERADMALSVLDGLLSASSFADRVYGSLARALRQGDVGRNEAAAVRALWEGYGHRENRYTRHAVAAFTRAAALDPNSAIAHLELAMALAAAGDHRRAADALITASALDDGYRDMTANLIRALQSGEGPEAALEAVRLYQDGILALSRGDFDTAERLLRQSLDHDVKLHPAHATLGYLLMYEERLEEARVALLEYVAAADRPAAHAHGDLALIYTVRGEAEQARNHARKALALDAAFADRFGRFCQTLFEEQDYAAAAAELDRLVEEGVYFPPFVIRFLHEHAESAP